MSWWQLGPSLLAAVLLLFGPGLVIGASIGLRRLSLVASAPAIGVTLVSLWALAAGFLGIAYSPVQVVLATLIASVLALAVRLAVRSVRGSVPRQEARPSVVRVLGDDLRALWPALMGTVVAAALIGWRLKVTLDRPENVSQTYDNIFHLNAVQYGIESGDASSLTITRFLSDVDAPSMYPAAWHDTVILVAQLTNGSVPFSVNATNIVLAAVVWPLGSIFLARQVFGAKARVALWTGILSAAFPAFPLLMLDFGVLYPYMMSLALLPVAIGLLVGAFRAADDPDSGRTPAWCGLLLTLPGLGLAHPSSVLSFLLLTTPFLVHVVVRRLHRLSRTSGAAVGYIWPVVLLALFLEVLRRLWIAVRPLPEASLWEARATQAQALGEALAAAPLERPVAWVLLGLTLGGFFVLVRRGPVWLAVSFGLATALYVVANGTIFGDFRSFVTGVWYNDPFRLAALLPIIAVPVTVAATLALHSVLEHGTARIGTSSVVRSRLGVATAGGVALLLAWSSQGQAMDVATASAAGQYRLTNDAPLLSADERQLLERVDEIVPEDETVVGSPWTGASLVYPLADRESVTPYVFGGRNGNVALILERLSDVSQDPAVCDAVRSEGSYWVLDFGLREVHGGAHTSPGLLDVAENPGLELVARVGDARLYEIATCPR